MSFKSIVTLYLTLSLLLVPIFAHADSTAETNTSNTSETTESSTSESTSTSTPAATGETTTEEKQPDEPDAINLAPLNAHVLNKMDEISTAFSRFLQDKLLASTQTLKQAGDFITLSFADYEIGLTYPPITEFQPNQKIERINGVDYSYADGFIRITNVQIINNDDFDITFSDNYNLTITKKNNTPVTSSTINLNVTIKSSLRVFRFNIFRWEAVPNEFLINDTSYLLNIDINTLIPSGSITISAPPTLVFSPYRLGDRIPFIKRQLSNWAIQVTDTRQQTTPWYVLGQTHDDGYGLSKHLVFKTAQETLPLTSAVKVGSQSTVSDGSSITWPDDQGILIDTQLLKDSDAGQTYSANIEWTLVIGNE